MPAMMEHPTTPWGGYLSVSELNQQIQLLLEEGFPYVQVRGEVSGLRRPPSGHAYFTLLDGEAQIRAVVWRNTLRRLPIPPAEGEAVLVTGRVSVYPPRGEYQLIVEGLKSTGAGDERELLLRLHARLQGEGLFDESRKRPLPYLPRCIGVVTSAGGAVIHDITRVLDQRFPAYHLILAHARVQGEGAAEEIAHGLELLNQDGRAQVIICGRGGGSAEDLAPFNSERVVRAIAASRIPVVSAVGHEVDLTLADLAADWRAPTPSAAAERIMPERALLAARLATLRQRLEQAGRRLIAQRREQTGHLQQRLRHPRQRLDQARLRCEELQQRLENAARGHLRRRREPLGQLRGRLLAWPAGRYLSLPATRLHHLEDRLHQGIVRLLAARRQRLAALGGKLESLSPGGILARGYAIVRTADGALLRDAAATTPGTPLEITLARGGVSASVTALHPEPAEPQE